MKLTQMQRTDRLKMIDIEKKEGLRQRLVHYLKRISISENYFAIHSSKTKKKVRNLNKECRKQLAEKKKQEIYQQLTSIPILIHWKKECRKQSVEKNKLEFHQHLTSISIPYHTGVLRTVKTNALHFTDLDHCFYDIPYSLGETINQEF